MKETRELEEAQEILEIPISYEEKGKEIGREEGRKEGRKEGLKEGIEVGRKEGMEVGKKEGQKEERLAVALELLREGISKEIIMKTTKLSQKKIEELEWEL